MRITIDIDERALSSHSMGSDRWDAGWIDKLLASVAMQQHALEAGEIRSEAMVVARWAFDRSVKWQVGISPTMEHHEEPEKPQRFTKLADAAGYLAARGWVLNAFRAHCPVFVHPDHPGTRKTILHDRTGTEYWVEDAK